MLKTPVDTGNGMTVKIATKAQQGASATGHSTWTGAPLLARALCAEAPRHSDINDCSSPHTAVAVDADWSVVGKTCLELGCGTAKHQGGASIRRHVWETDRPLRHWSNADACNDPTFCPRSLADDDVYDCIMAADVLYLKVQVEPLVHTQSTPERRGLRLNPSDGANAHDGNGP